MEKHSAPGVCIIILNWNGLADTIECLESLKQLTYPNYRIVVVDNASSGNDVEMLKQRYGDYAHIIANDRNYGFPEGNNIGIRYALNEGADYVLLLNNDTVVDPEFLSELVTVAESDESIGIAGSKIYFYGSPNRIQTTGGKFYRWLGHQIPYGGKEDHGQYDRVADRDYLFGASMLIKRKVTERISLLDSTFFYGMDDFDFCFRAKRAGFRVVYVPGSRIWHKGGASRAQLRKHPETLDLIKKKKGVLSTKFSYRLFRKNLPFPLFIIPFLGFTAIQLIVFLRDSFVSILRRAPTS